MLRLSFRLEKNLRPYKVREPPGLFSGVNWPFLGCS